MDPPSHSTATTKTWVLTSADASGGELYEQRVEYRAGSPFPPAHVHPAQDEHFEVEAGAMVFVVNGEERVVPTGGSIDIPRGTPHKARNASETASATVRWETRPALRSQQFFATAAAISTSPLDGALLADEFADVFRLAGPMALAVPVLARIARLSGRRLPS